MPKAPNKRIYPPPPPATKEPKGYIESTGAPVYGKVKEEDIGNYAEFSDPIQRLFYAVLGAIPKPQEAIKGIGKFATTSPKELGTQALQAVGRAGSRPGMDKHLVMATGEGMANTLLQFFGIPSESMAQRASTGDISGAIGEGYGTYLAGRGMGEVGKRTGKVLGANAREFMEFEGADIQKYLKNKFKKQDWSTGDEPKDIAPDLQDASWWKDPKNAKQYLDSGGSKELLHYMQTGNWPGQHKGSFYDPYQKQPEDNWSDPDKFANEYGQPIDWIDEEEKAHSEGGQFGPRFKGKEVTQHRPQHGYGQELFNQPKSGHPNPEDYNSLKEFSRKGLYGHILNSLYTGFDDSALIRLKNEDPDFEQLSEGIAAWKGSPRHIQEITGDILFGNLKKAQQSQYEYPMARALADAYRTAPEVDYTLYRGIIIGEFHDPTPYLQLKPGDKLPFYRLHGYTKSERMADGFSAWKQKYQGEGGETDPPYWSVKFVVEGPKKSLNITHINGFESEAEHLMNGEYVVKQVVQNGKKIKIIMQQERPLYAGQEEAKPMGPGGEK